MISRVNFILLEATVHRPEVFYKKGTLRNFVKFTGHLCQSFFIKKEALAQVYSCDFYEISKNIFYCRTRLVAASALFYKLLSE